MNYWYNMVLINAQKTRTKTISIQIFTNANMLTNPINSAVDKVYCLVFKPQYFGRKLYNSLVHGCTNINMHEKLDLHAIFSVFTKHVHVKMDVVALK